MIKIEDRQVYGWEAAIRGMRNPLLSYDRSDSWFRHSDLYYHKITGEICSADELIDPDDLTPDYILGPNDKDLMKRLASAGKDHAKYRRMIVVYADITAPLYWLKEWDTYKVGTVSNSCSTMHKIQAKEFTLDDFSCENLIDTPDTSRNHEIEFDETFSKILPIEGYDGYYISENGVVYSDKGSYRIALVQRIDIDNYKTVGLYKNGQCKRFKVHRLVANAFLPKIEGKECVNHIDGNKWNNKATNLEWCTNSENSKHAFANGLNKYGNKQRIGARKKARLTEEQVLQIKKLYSEGHSQREIGEMFKYDHTAVHDIIAGDLYKPIQLTPVEILESTIEELNDLRDKYLDTNDKSYWYSMIQLLPSSYNQKRTVMLNYEVLANIYPARKSHKLDEWRVFCDWIESLPESWIITGEEK